MTLRMIEMVEWKDIRNSVKAVNAALATLIDGLATQKLPPLIQVTFAFGDLIFDQGTIYVPNRRGQLVTIDQLEKPFNTFLSYNTIPLGLILEKEHEIFLDIGSRIVPINLLHPGNLIGIFETLSLFFRQRATVKWCLSAGSRSIFMLPKITDNGGLDRLKNQYNIPNTLRIKDLQDHWELFKIMAQHSSFKPIWNSIILLFPKNWLTHLNSLAFKECLYAENWKQSLDRMEKLIWGLEWSYFSELISSRNLKPRPYLADQMRHILLIAANRSPGIRPIDNYDDSAAPGSSLQSAITSIYGLKDYFPTLMHICPLDTIKHRPVYYSLSYPTLLEGTSSDKSTTTILTDLKKLKQLLDTLKNFPKNIVHFENNLLNKIEFEYFNVDADIQQAIQNSQTIFKQDSGFQLKTCSPNRILCHTSQFWRGCIKIKRLRPAA